MKFRFLLATTFLLLGFSVSSLLRADDEIGSVNEDGFTLAEDNYYTKSGELYSREWVEGQWYQQQVWVPCCGWKWQWFKTAGQYNYTKVISKTAINRWALLAKFKAQIEDNRLFSQALQASFPTPPQTSIASNAYSHQSQSFAGGNQVIQVNTPPYGGINANQALQDLFSAIGLIPPVLDRAIEGGTSVVQTVVDGNSQAALMQTKANFALTVLPALLKQLETSQQITTTTATAQTDGQGVGTSTTTTTIPAAQAVDTSSFERFNATVLQPRCAQCHANAQGAGWKKFNLPAYAAMSYQDRMSKVVPYLNFPNNPYLTKDPSAPLMPKDHPALTVNEFFGFLKTWNGGGGQGNTRRQ
jgi:hypothetical protein